MTNKDKLKNIIDNDFDKNNNYNDILRKIEGNNSMKKYGYVLTFACFVLVVGVILFNNFNTDETVILEEPIIEDNIIFNNISVSDNSASIDAYPVYVGIGGNADIDGSAVEKDLLGKFSFLSNLNIPHDYELKRMFELYVRGDNNSSDYDKLWQYDVYFTTVNVETGVTKEISIIFTPEDYILSCYKFNWNDFPKSTISSIDVGLYSDGVVSNEAFFEYEGYKFYVKSNDITKEEFINLIKSIVE